MSDPIVYDKAKYHFGSVEENGLREIHAFIHTGFYVGWLVENDLLDSEFADEFGDAMPKFLAREITAPELYYQWDGALDDTMLNDEGNAFTQAYFDFEKGRYIHDYVSTLADGLPTEFHVDDSWENYDRANSMISERYSQWKAGKNVSARPWWKFWA